MNTKVKYVSCTIPILKVLLMLTRSPFCPLLPSIPGGPELPWKHIKRSVNTNSKCRYDISYPTSRNSREAWVSSCTIVTLETRIIITRLKTILEASRLIRVVALTVAPLLPGGPAAPDLPLIPFDPGSPNGPSGPMSPTRPCVCVICVCVGVWG